MATVKYRLDKPSADKKKEVAIYCRVTLDRNHRFEFSTKQRIPVKSWDAVLQEAKPSYKGSIQLNKTLNKLKGDLLDLWNDNKSITIDDLRKKSLNLIQFGDQDTVQKKRNDLELFIKDFIQKCEEGKIIRSANTIKAYKTSLRNFKDFSQYSGRHLTFDSINLDWYYEFCAWCWDVEDDKETRKAKKLAGIRPKETIVDSSVGKFIKDLKTFMKDAYEADLHKNLSIKKKQFKKLESESDSIYLSEEEILTIYNLDLSEHPHLIESRDLFVFDCWVGLRYSDLTRIKPEQIQGNVLRIRTKKTGEDVVIPFHPIAQAIFNKYEGSLPEAKANANFNYDVKAVGALTGSLVSLQTVRHTIRNITTVNWVKKWELITAHTARRSFATNCYKMGVPTRSIMAITGHRTEKAFNKYIKLSKEEHASIMLEHFQKSTLMKVSA
jgi:integrase